jgi:phospholipase C
MLVNFRLAAATAALVALSLPASAQQQTMTPIKHLVVIFNENNSFDHYFGTYPNALNPPGEVPFRALPGTPTVNGLQQTLLATNPSVGAAPFRLDPLQIQESANGFVCDNSNSYKNEQAAVDHGLVDQYPAKTSATGDLTLTQAVTGASINTGIPCIGNLSMGYYDGNTVTALWNYAQHYAMSDNFYGTEFGVTVEGHINLISGQTHTTATISSAAAADLPHGSIIKNINPDPSLDDCTSGATITMTSPNIGDLLNNQGVTWGWFYQDFTPQSGSSNSHAVCLGIYNPHFDPFMYYASTANPHHLPPSSPEMIGHIGDQSNHQYDLNAFFTALGNGNLPSVSFVKFDVLDTGHPADSNPANEQRSLVTTINAIQQSKEWSSTAIIVTYDDSDGWYDHVSPPIVNPSNDSSLDSTCLSPAIPLGGFLDRCGYGPRLPFLAISPFAKRNYVDSAVIDQTSILRFIEENWGLGFIDGPNPPAAAGAGTNNLAPPGATPASFDQLAGSILGLFDFTAPPNLRPLILNPTTGEVVFP